MAIEIPNVCEAAGLFDGASAPAGGPIVSAEGFLPYNALTSPSVPLGGFTRVIAGSYILQLVNPIDGLEGVVHCTKFLRPTLPNTAIPAANIFVDGGVGVGDSGHAIDSGVDFAFYLAIFRMKYGPNGTAG